MDSFITSKKGQISSNITIYSYLFTIELLNQKIQLDRFIKWLKKPNEEVILYELNDTGFKTLTPLKEVNTWQYSLVSINENTPPYSNIQKISAYISSVIRNSFSICYKRYLNENIYETDVIYLDSIILRKCIQFNIELFDDGIFYVHFLPITKITSNEDISFDIIDKLRHDFTSHTRKDVTVFLIETYRFKKLKIDLFSEGDYEKAKIFFQENKKVIISFDYHFIASYSRDIFISVTEKTIKDIDESIIYLQEKLDCLEFDEWLNFQKKLFYKVEKLSFGKKNNLVVGCNQVVNRQSSAYYNGMYQPANKAILLPVLVDKYPRFNFSEYIDKFNKNASSFDLLEPITIISNDENRFNFSLSLKEKYRDKKILLAIFTEYEQPKEFLQPLKEKKISFQIYLGKTDRYKLSNFSVKCLEKLGGLLSIINDTEENEHTYFVGIDLGHSRDNKEPYSNLGLVFFDNKGQFIHSYVNKKIKRNEAISSEILWACFASFRKYIERSNKPYPEKIVIHRDGKLHKEDISSIIKQSKKQLNIDYIEVVEIIKQGYPVYAGFDQGAYVNLESGDCFIHNNYAILITNIQADEKNALVNPIIIKHRFGNDSMAKIVNQVYWLTKIYTNNLYNSTRLPATTLKANNIVGTSSKEHRATYTG